LTSVLIKHRIRPAKRGGWSDVGISLSEMWSVAQLGKGRGLHE